MNLLNLKKSRSIFKGEFFWLGLVIILAAFLYFYKIGQWQYLNYDQARDYLIIKKILLDKKLTLIGPSLGNLDGGYLPPFYYYFLAPSLLVSRFHLWGPDALSALVGLLAVAAFFITARDLFGKLPAILGSLFFVFNPFMIQAARHTRDPHMLPAFVLIFFFSFKKYLLDRKKPYIFLAALSLGVAVSLHLTAAVFLPFLIYLLYREGKNSLSPRLWFSSAVFLAFFAPLAIFIVRHDFLMIKAVGRYLAEGRGDSFGLLAAKIARALVFLVKIPLIFFSGLYQKQLLSLRSWPLSSVDEAKILATADELDKLKLFISGTWLVLGCYLLKELRKKSGQLIRLVLLFTLAGFLVSFMCDLKACFLYYFYNLFPFLVLLVSAAVAKLLQKASWPKKALVGFLVALWAFLPFFPQALSTETRPESYFLPACEAIANDFPAGKKVVVAAHINDISRWEKNALEYRYFLEAIYRLPLSGWTEADYQEADVLYFIDEEGLREPLKLGGMEMEAFGPIKISNFWIAREGQKIYRIEK